MVCSNHLQWVTLPDGPTPSHPTMRCALQLVAEIFRGLLPQGSRCHRFLGDRVGQRKERISYHSPRPGPRVLSAHCRVRVAPVVPVGSVAPCTEPLTTAFVTARKASIMERQRTPITLLFCACVTAPTTER